MTRRVLAGISLLHMTVLLSPEAQAEFDELPVVIRARVLRVFDRLARVAGCLRCQGAIGTVGGPLSAPHRRLARAVPSRDSEGRRGSHPTPFPSL